MAIITITALLGAFLALLGVSLLFPVNAAYAPLWGFLALCAGVALIVDAFLLMLV